MGTTKSRYQWGQFSELPVCSLRSDDGIFVIHTPDNRYIRQTKTILRLKDNKEPWTIMDGLIADSNGMNLFNITAPINSRPIYRTLLDQLGNEIASYHLQSDDVYGMAYIIRKTEFGKCCAATIRRRRGKEVINRCNADIFIHNPLIPMEYLSSMEGMVPSIKVEGNFKSKKYDFMQNMGIMNGSQMPWRKFAEVSRDSITNTDLESKPNHLDDRYYLKVGANVDIAFICICCYALEELFSCKILNKRRRKENWSEFFGPCSRHNIAMCQMQPCVRERLFGF